MGQKHIELVRSSLDGWNRGDVDAWLRAAHPEIEWHTLWEPTIEVSEIRDLGDKVLALARIRARGDASGIDLERPVAYVFEFHEGLARKVGAYLDPQQALEAVGLAE